MKQSKYFLRAVTQRTEILTQLFQTSGFISDAYVILLSTQKQNFFTKTRNYQGQDD